MKSLCDHFLTIEGTCDIIIEARPEEKVKFDYRHFLSGI